MSKTLTIVARIEANKENIDVIKSEALKLVEPTLAEEGCIQYVLHQDNENLEVFIFIEKWKNHELWQKHMDSHHLQTFIKHTEGLLVDLKISQMSCVCDI